MNVAVIDRPSPNHGPRRPGIPLDLVVLHYTGMASGAAALARLCDPAAEVSAHYLIEEDGRLYRLVPEARRAWHAGVAVWRRERDVNSRSIGIELVNPGHDWGYRPFPPAQMAGLLALLGELCDRLAIPRANVVGHSDVAPGRKADPGELFDWAALARAGFGLWPAADFAVSPHAPALGPGQTGPAVLDLQIALDAIGYGVEGTGLYDPATLDAVSAFQRHFRPARLDGVADPETASLIFHLAETVVSEG